MVHQKNRRIHSGHGFTGSFEVYDPDRSWITDPDPDHPKGTQPYSPQSRSLDLLENETKIFTGAVGGTKTISMVRIPSMRIYWALGIYMYDQWKCCIATVAENKWWFFSLK